MLDGIRVQSCRTCQHTRLARSPETTNRCSPLEPFSAVSEEGRASGARGFGLLAVELTKCLFAVLAGHLGLSQHLLAFIQRGQGTKVKLARLPFAFKGCDEIGGLMQLLVGLGAGGLRLLGSLGFERKGFQVCERLLSFGSLCRAQSVHASKQLGGFPLLLGWATAT